MNDRRDHAETLVKFWRTPLDLGDVKLPHGQVRLIVDRCKGCGFCVEYCPRGVLALSDAFNRKGYHPPEAVKPDECIDCGLCELICPDFAIYSVPVEGGIAAAAAKPPRPQHGGSTP